MFDYNEDQENPEEITKLPTDNEVDRQDTKRTQTVKPPRNVSSTDDSTMAFDNPLRRASRENTDPGRDTAVISKDNPILRRAISHQQQSESSPDLELFNDAREVILLIRGMVERLSIVPGKAYILGRFEMASKADEIDLTPYGAMDRGVSRHHAQLHLEDDKLFLTDLESTNGTYLSGVKLNPHEPVAVRKGDEVLLGRLSVQVLFR